MAIELTVVLKDSERTYRHKNLIYQSITLDPTDPVILSFIEMAKLNFQGDPEDIIIKALMVCK